MTALTVLGKTTIAQKLSDTYNIPIYHLTYYQDREKFQKQFDTATEMINEWIRGERDGFILDRYILSEYAYQKVYRPDIPLVNHAELMLELLEHRASTGEIDVIIALPQDRSKWFELFQALTNEREEMYSGEKMLNVFDEYEKLWSKMRYNKHVYRYDLFENIKGENKNKILEINDEK